MSKLYCSLCSSEIDNDEYHYVNNEPVCQSCFEDNYHYCSRCDSVIHNNNTFWNSYGDPFCESCWEDENEDSFDEECPNNPSVTEQEQQVIVLLANQWLNDDNPKLYNVNIHQGDFGLDRLKTGLGLVANPVYLFGLYDRTDFQILVSRDLEKVTREFVEFNNLDWKISVDRGVKRVGLSYSIREKEFDLVFNLLKEITEGGVLCAA